MTYKEKVNKVVREINEIARFQNKPTGFSIGNTAKIEKSGMYFTPIRNLSRMIIAGVVVYSKEEASDIAKLIDGKVDYILVDAEEKIPGNIEQLVRKTVKKSTLWVFKGNDLAVEAADNLLTTLTKSSSQGIRGKRIAILGAGNLGSKLALKLVERGAFITITNLEGKGIKLVSEVFNLIKSVYNTAKIVGTTDNEAATDGADILIGTTDGVPVITAKMIKQLAHGAMVFDIGKGTLYPDAIKLAEKLNLQIYRLDITAALEGKISGLFAAEHIVEKKMGRRLFKGESIVSGGLMGRAGEIVVDDINKPGIIHGIADGKGDFMRSLSKYQIRTLRVLNEKIGK